MIEIYSKYDNTFVNLIAMQYFNHGTKVMISLAAKDLFKAYYHLEPSESQTLGAFIAIPWSFRILYGLISDNVPLFGSRRKSYLQICAVLQFVCMIGLAVIDIKSEIIAVWLLFMFSITMAFSDVIVDSLMVIQARKDPRLGAGELNAFMATMLAIGGLCGSIIAGVLTENYDPRYCFVLSSIIGLSIVYSSIKLDKKIEEEGNDAQ